MATTEELQKRKKWLSNKIATLTQNDITSTTAAKRLASMKATEKYRAELSEINRQLAGEAKTPPKSKSNVPLPKGPIIAENAPANVDSDIWAQLAAEVPGFDVANAAMFQQGGIGNTSLVWLGETNKPGGLTMKGGKPVTTVVPTVNTINRLTTDFWNDQKLQGQIISAYAAKGKSISTVEAYGIWGQLVKTAAEIYQGGKGAKVTPMQLLTDSLKSVKGDEPTLPTRSISKLDRTRTFEQIDAWAQNTLMAPVNAEQKAALFDILSEMNTGTLTEYKKVKNKKTGKMENVQVTTPGLTEERAQKTVEQKLKELNPDDVDRAQRIKFSDWISQNLAGA